MLKLTVLALSLLVIRGMQKHPPDIRTDHMLTPKIGWHVKTFTGHIIAKCPRDTAILTFSVDQTNKGKSNIRMSAFTQRRSISGRGDDFNEPERIKAGRDAGKIDD
jgi:hypothetical protein